jgi:hypothetical protein
MARNLEFTLNVANASEAVLADHFDSSETLRTIVPLSLFKKNVVAGLAPRVQVAPFTPIGINFGLEPPDERESLLQQLVHKVRTHERGPDLAMSRTMHVALVFSHDGRANIVRFSRWRS